MAGPRTSSAAGRDAENIALVERSFEGLNNRDLDAVFECFSDDCVFDGSRMTEGIYRGKHAYRRFLEGVMDSLGHLEHGELTLLAAGDDQVVAVAAVRVSGTMSQAATGGRIAYLYRIRDGLIHHQEIHPDAEQLLGSLSLDE